MPGARPRTGFRAARRAWVCGGAITVALLATPGDGAAEGGRASAAARARPNVVVVTTDDWTLRIARHMPNFRRLARRGTTFTNYFASYSLCCPARTTFLTGQYAHNHGVRSNFFQNRGGFNGFRRQRNSLPVWLRRAGYRTAFVGKYLNEYGADGPHRIPPGWGDWHGLLDFSTYNYFNWAINDNGRLRYFGDRRYAKALIALARAGVEGKVRSVGDVLSVGRRVFRPFDYFGTAHQRDYQVDVVGRIANRALRRGLRSRKPLFLWYTPIAAHKEADFERLAGLRPGPAGPDPRPPRRYAHAYDRVGPPKDPSVDEADVSDKPANVRDRPRLSAAVRLEIKRNERGRLGAARAADDAVGRMLRTLKRSGEQRRTLFIYTTDQGYIQGQHRVPDNKYLPFEPSIHIPLVVAGPGQPTGRRVSDLVFNHDLAPTIVDATGARPRRVMDGLSLLPRLHGRRLRRRNLLLEALEPALPFRLGVPLFDLQAPYYGVRTTRYKYVKWSFGDEELYDLRRDPYELDNLASDPRHASLKSRLSAEARRLRKCRGRRCNR